MLCSDIPTQVWPSEFVQRYQQAGYWQGETFGSLLHTRATQYPNQVAVIGGEQRWTYAELDQKANAVAAQLLLRGFKAGDRIIVHLPNVPEFISAIFGMFRIGVI